MKLKLLIYAVAASVAIGSMSGCFLTEQKTSEANTSALRSSSGKEAKNEESVSPLSDNGTALSAETAVVNETLTLKAAVKGGKAPYTYSLSHKTDNEKWSDAKQQSGSEFQIKMPSSACQFTVKMDISDSLGEVLTKMFVVTVRQDTRKELQAKAMNVSAEYVCSGTNSLFVSAEFEGGTLPYKYSYSYISPNGEETELKDDSDVQSAYLKFDTVPGEYTIRVTAEDSAGSTAYIEKTLHSSTCLPVENICQYSEPELPTGCEVTSLAICLNYYGFDVSKNTLADEFLPIGFFEFKDDEKYGPDLEYEFAGNPNAEESYGCFSHCIAETANQYFQSVDSSYIAKPCNGNALEELYAYLNQGKPVILWSTMYLAESFVSDTWKTEDGKTIEFRANEHCTVLAGYDKERNIVYVADPLSETDELEEYDKDLFEQRYNEMGKHAVIIQQPQ